MKLNIIERFILRVLCSLRSKYVKKFFCYEIYKLKNKVKNISIHPNAIIDESVKLSLGKNADVVIENGVTIRSFTEIQSEGKISIGENVFIGRFVTIACREKIIIGKNSGIAESASIRDHDHIHQIITQPVIEQGYVDSPIIIGDNVWIGAKVTILKGVHIGDNSIVGANAVVIQDIPANAIAVGVPAKVIKMRGEGL